MRTDGRSSFLLSLLTSPSGYVSSLFVCLFGLSTSNWKHSLISLHVKLFRRMAENRWISLTQRGRKQQNIQVSCDICKKEFDVKPCLYKSRMEHGTRKLFYCSRGCFGKSMRARAQSAICSYCKRLFIVPGNKVLGRLKPGKEHFCSRHCSSSYHACRQRHAEMRARWTKVLGPL